MEWDISNRVSAAGFSITVNQSQNLQVTLFKRTWGLHFRMDSSLHRLGDLCQAEQFLKLNSSKEPGVLLKVYDHVRTKDIWSLAISRWTLQGYRTTCHWLLILFRTNSKPSKHVLSFQPHILPCSHTHSSLDLDLTIYTVWWTLQSNSTHNSDLLIEYLVHFQLTPIHLPNSA